MEAGWKLGGCAGGLSRLTNLDLSFNDHLRDLSAAALADLLATEPSIRRASLRITGITTGGAQTLLACMSPQDPWRCLDLAVLCNTITQNAEDADVAAADMESDDGDDVGEQIDPQGAAAHA